MQKILLFTIILVFKTGILNAQYGRNWVDKGIEDPFTKEYFLKPLFEEVKKTFPYSEPENIKEIEEVLSNKKLAYSFDRVFRYELEKIKSEMEERAATISGKFSFFISTFIFFRQQTSRAGEKSKRRARKRNM